MIDSVPSVTMNGGICIRVTSTPLRQPKNAPQSEAERKGEDVGTPSITARRPITTDEITMMTPIDRSMPAVRITSVWPMPRMPVTITWVRTVEKLLAAVKRDGLTAHAEQQAEHQHDEGNGGRIDMQEALQRAAAT